jgi:branched-chain amino acid transport system permease protein
MDQVIWAGLVAGAAYALVAVGYVVAWVPSSGVLNFAQGALVVGGMYLAYFFMTTLGLPESVAIVGNVVIGLVAGALCELVAVKPLRRGSRARHGHPELVTTIGVSTALAGLYGVIWTYNDLEVPFHGPQTIIRVAGADIVPVELVLVGVALLSAIVAFAWFQWSRLGHACFAVAQDRDAAMLRGINAPWMSTAGFAAAGALAGIAGAVIGPVTYVDPTMANTLSLDGFVALAIGGAGKIGPGNLPGCVAGALLIGIASSAAIEYIGASYADVTTLGILVAILILKPTGLGGRAEQRRV